MDATLDDMQLDHINQNMLDKSLCTHHVINKFQDNVMQDTNLSFVYDRVFVKIVIYRKIKKKSVSNLVTNKKNKKKV